MRGRRAGGREGGLLAAAWDIDRGRRGAQEVASQPVSSYSSVNPLGRAALAFSVVSASLSPLYTTLRPLRPRRRYPRHQVRQAGGGTACRRGGKREGETRPLWSRDASTRPDCDIFSSLLGPRPAPPLHQIVLRTVTLSHLEGGRGRGGREPSPPSAFLSSSTSAIGECRSSRLQSHHVRGVSLRRVPSVALFCAARPCPSSAVPVSLTRPAEWLRCIRTRTQTHTQSLTPIHVR